MDYMAYNGTISAGQYLSQQFQGLTKEERRKRLLDAIEKTEIQVCEHRRDMTKTKDKIETARAQYENFNDLIQTMENLKVSLEEHIRTVKINKGSLGSIPAVLQHDKGKERTHVLINVIKALTQLRIVKENFKKESEDQNSLFDSLLEMQQSQKILRTHLKDTMEEDKSLNELKDQFFAWQSTALIFAIQQSDYNRLLSIQHSYEAMDRSEEFISMFQQVSVNCLKEFHFNTSSVQQLVEELHKQMAFIYTHHYQILRRFLPDEKASGIIHEAMKQGLDACDLTTPLTILLSETDNIILTMEQISKTLTNLEKNEESNIISKLLVDRMGRELVTPVKNALTTYMLAKVTSMDTTTPGSFRSKVETLKTSIADLMQMLHDVIAHSSTCFGDRMNEVVESPINRALTNFLAILKNWELSLDKMGDKRGLGDIMSICSASGQLMYGLEEIKTFANTEISLSGTLKSAKKWNRVVVEAVLKMACEMITGKMVIKMEAMKESTATSSVASGLPSFSTFPHEYITTAGQDLLQLFHQWDQFFLDDNISHSFFVAYKKKFLGDDLFKRTVNDVADKVMSQFIATVGDVNSLKSDVARQFSADAGFLKDALEDLRAGNTAELEELRENLKKVTGI